MISSLSIKIESGVNSLTSICYHYLRTLVHVRKGLENLGMQIASVAICMFDEYPEDGASNHLAGVAEWFKLFTSIAQLFFNLVSDLIKVISLFIINFFPSGMPTAHHA